MATRQEDLKQDTVHGAAERLAALRNTQMGEAEAVRDGKTEEVADDVVEDVIEEAAEEIVEETPQEDVPPSEEEDIFADELGNLETDTSDAPAALSKEGKELFSQLSPELQTEVEERIKAAERGATRKVQQAAEKEKEVEQLANEVLKLKEEYSRKLTSMDETLPEPPDPDLADVNSDRYDPDRFNVEQARYQRAMRDVEGRREERRKAAEEQQKQAQATQQKTLESQARKIVEYFPSWNTQDKFVAGVQGVQNFLVSQGIKPEVASRVTDPDMIRITYMASRYAEAKKKARARKTTTSAPSGRPRTQTTTDVSKVKDRLSQTGSLDDAVEVLKATRRR